MSIEQGCEFCCDAGADFDWCRVCGRGELPFGKYDPAFLRMARERQEELESRYVVVYDTVVLDEIMKMSKSKSLISLKNILKWQQEKEDSDE